jgi:spore coat polysaccharide biosynthesis protein SpsF
MNYIFIQARMNSSRLPGKVLMEICGKPMLQHIIERVQYSKSIDKIIVVTSTNAENDAIQNLCDKLKIDCFRGSEDDVLDRFQKAIKHFNINDNDTVVRVTADCAFVCPDLIDYMLSIHDGDLTVNCCDDNWTGAERTYPNGLDVEIFQAGILTDPHFNEINFFEIEYSPEFLNNKCFKVRNIKHDPDLSKHWWTLDTPEDFEFIKGIYEKLYKPGQIFLMEDILNEIDTRTGKLR